MLKLNKSNASGLRNMSSLNSEDSFYWDIGKIDGDTIFPIYGPKSCRDSIGMDVIYKHTNKAVPFGDFHDSHKSFDSNHENGDKSKLIFLAYVVKHKSYDPSVVQSILLDKVLNPLKGDRPTELVLHSVIQSTMESAKCLHVFGFDISDHWWKSTVSILLYTFLIRAFLRTRVVKEINSANSLVKHLHEDNREESILNGGSTFKYLSVEEYLNNIDYILGDAPLTGLDDKEYLDIITSDPPFNKDYMNDSVSLKGVSLKINGVSFKSQNKNLTGNAFFGGMGPVGLSSVVDYYIKRPGTDEIKLSSASNPVSHCMFPVWVTNYINLIYELNPKLAPEKPEVKINKLFKQSALAN